MTETTAQHKHRFPCNPPGGTLLRPGDCVCGKTYPQDEADRMLSMALKLVADAYGTEPRVDEHWCVAWGGEDANDCAGLLEYDDQADAEGMTQWIDGGFAARRTVIRLPWETVPGEVTFTFPHGTQVTVDRAGNVVGSVQPCGCDSSHRCLDCATGDEVPAVRALDAIFGHVRSEVES